MKHEKMLSKAFNSIVLIIIISVLTAAVFLVYRIFEKGVEADIFIYTRDLQESVRRTSSLELRRYILLIELGKSMGADIPDEEFAGLLEDNSSMLSADGELPHLVSSIGYFFTASPETAFEYDIETGDWSEVNETFSKKDLDRGMNWYIEEDPAAETAFFAVENSGGERAVFFRVNLRGFIDNYVKEFIESSNDEFTIEWLWAADHESRISIEEHFENRHERYHFRPFRILSGLNRNAESLFIEIPGPFEVRKFIDRIDVVPDEEQDKKIGRPGFLDGGVFIKMVHEQGAYYHDIEYKTAVSFIETILIFIIIGVLFILLFLQLQRSRMMRNKEKEFVASVTHELRTPLTVIRSAADNLSTGIVQQDKLKIYGSLISEQSDRLGNMIEEILLYSKFEDKRHKPETPVRVEFANLVSQIKPALEALASGEHNLIWDSRGLPETGLCYPDVITLAVNNLVSNAVNHAYTGFSGDDATGEIRIRLRFLIPDKLQITVEDDGRGIDARELRRIFEPFYRDNVSRERQEKGSGLGLFITRRKAVIAGGKLTAESPYKRVDGSRPPGCRFTLTLPCGTGEKKQEAEND